MAARFAALVVMTPRPQLARAAPHTNALGIYRRLAATRTRLLTGARPTGYAGHVVAYENVWNGEPGEIDDVRLFAYSTPRRANDSLAADLVHCNFAVHLIGDARAPRPLTSAIHEAFSIGDSI